MEEPVTIVDREVLKVLSTDTRMDILKELSQGGRTPSDLGKKLKKSDATIVEHLGVLCKSGLVKKIEQPGRKWIFYTLTERGEGIISSRSRRLIIILATSIIALIGGFFSFAKYFVQSGFSATSLPRLNIEIGAEVSEKVIAPAIQTTIFLYLSLILFAIAVVGFVLYFLKKPKIK